MRKTQIYILLFAALLLLPALACGGSNGGDTPTEPAATSADTVKATVDQPADTSASVEEPEATEAPPPASGAVDNLQDVSKAVVQIVARGTFVDPDVGLQLNAAGSGTGFIIDESGIAVTNNHVVTGAAALEVYVGGDTSPLNARVLAVSECSDLAVIDIDGEGFPFLDWYEGPITVGLDVYAAGFPLGDPEFTLTRGIVSKENANGDTNWASVDSVLQHDATINPGNSGGPLVDSDGHVVGVNYAGASGVDQYFAIARDEALRHIDVLRNSVDVTSIGINGSAVTDGESIYGIWVSSVDSGSPADQARIEPGDIITSMEDLVLGVDGTMSDYCDILRTRSPGDAMDIQVLRFSTGEVLEGQLNGRELETTVVFGRALEDEVAADAEGSAANTYTAITDDSGLLVVEVPTTWTETNGNSWLFNDVEVGLAVSAAPDLTGFLETWGTPGVFFAASDELSETTTSLLDGQDWSGSCNYDGRYDYADQLYTGFYDLWLDCAGEGTIYVVLAAEPEDKSFLIYVAIQAVTEADLEALDHILDTFYVDVGG